MFSFLKSGGNSVAMDEFLDGGSGSAVLQSVTIPFSGEDEHLLFYRVANRSDFCDQSKELKFVRFGGF